MKFFSQFKFEWLCWMASVFGPLVGYIAHDIYVTTKYDALGIVVFIAWTGFFIILGIAHIEGRKEKTS